MSPDQTSDDPGRRSGSVRHAPDVVARQLDDEVVLVNLRTNRIYELNPTAARLWELLGSGCDVEQASERMLDEFEVEQAELAAEIDALVAQLASEGLVTRDEPS